MVPEANPPSLTSLMFSIADEVGKLDEVLRLIRKHNLSLSRIESRPSKTAEYDYDFFVDIAGHPEPATVQRLVDDLAPVVKHVKVAGIATTTVSPMASRAIVTDATTTSSSIAWFPRKKSDLDAFADRVLGYGSELDADHPGFTDQAYRQRRSLITENAKKYRHGQPIPEIEYTAEEKKTWETVFRKVTELYPTHACRQHQYVFPLLLQNCGYSPDNIPQLEHISRFLKECTGFTLRPVMGLLSSRDFLNGLAFRVFHSTQYIRHHSKPFYTPEPDVCHELLGHVPLFADPEFAEFSQEIGLASIGATDEDLEKLATIYWFTVEENGKLKAYGAGLLSSFGELEYCLSDKPKTVPFDPEKAATTKYPITQYQPLYFVAESFKSATVKVREFAAKMQRPFSVRYNSYTETVEVLDTKEKLVRYASNLRSEMTTLIDAISKLPAP